MSPARASLQRLAARPWQVGQWRLRQELKSGCSRPQPLAGVHVAAEHGGAARLDGAHDLEPGGVDAPFVALTESGAGAAEDLRHARAFGLHAPSVAQRCEA